MTTLAFIDFDGVFNAIPYENVWIGSNERTSHGFELLDPKNWETVDVPVNLETHFELDCKELVEVNDKKFLINYSSELVNEFKKLIKDPTVDFYWATTWRENAVNIINPLFGFSDELTKVLKWQSTSLSVRNPEIGKYFGISDYLNKLAKTKEISSNDKILWVDDVATMDHVDISEEEIATRLAYKHPDEILLRDNLVLRPDTRFGISRKELEEIKTFIFSSSSV